MAGDSTIAMTQKWLTQLGYDIGAADGIWGSRSQGALDALKASTLKAGSTYGVSRVAWGNKLKDDEIAKVAQIVKRLGMRPEAIHDMMGCIAWETDRTFSPSIKTPNASATGLIQFLEGTAKNLGTTTAKLATMSVVEQLEYVYAYFKPYVGKLNNLGDLYSAILWPRAVGQPDTYVLWNKTDPKTANAYSVNSGLDRNKDGTVTRAEILSAVINRMVEGFLPANVRAV